MIDRRLGMHLVLGLLVCAFVSVRTSVVVFGRQAQSSNNQQHPTGVAVLATEKDGQPVIVGEGNPLPVYAIDRVTTVGTYDVIFPNPTLIPGYNTTTPVLREYMSTAYGKWIYVRYTAQDRSIRAWWLNTDRLLGLLRVQ
jgi:hypothetical protein